MEGRRAVRVRVTAAHLSAVDPRARIAAVSTATTSALPVGFDVPVVVFDGDCNLCNGAVQFLLRRDRAARLRFCALESAAAKALLAARPQQLPDPLPDSMLLVHQGRVHLQSGAALRIAALLPWPWKALAIFLAVPAPLRDFCYRVVARNRHRWFGRPQHCLVPTPELRARFLDAGERRG